MTDGEMTIVDKKLTRKSQEALSEAVQMAAAAGNPSVDGLHLLAALVQQEGGTAAPLLRAVGADPADLLAKVRAELSRMPQAAGATVSAPQSSRQLLAALATASKLAAEMTDEYVSTEHLLVGLATDQLLRRHPQPGAPAGVARRGRAPQCHGAKAARLRTCRGVGGRTSGGDPRASP